MGHEAVLLLGFGGPTSWEEVRPFVLNVTRGKGVAQERIDAAIEKYRVIGGRSPFAELTQSQSRLLEGMLVEQGRNVPVKLGFLHWQPYIADTIKCLVDSQVSYVMAIIMTPHRAEASFAKYISAVNDAMLSLDCDNLVVDFAPSWYVNPLFIEAVVDRIKDKLSLIPDCERVATRIIFSAHSLPLLMAQASHYEKQVGETASAVAQLLKEPNWTCAYQSRSGGLREKWLEPDIAEAIRAAGQDGMKNVVVVPIGFVCDHMEVLYDLDVEAAAVAKQEGITMLRAETVGDHPQFIRMLSELLLTRVGSLEQR